MPAVSRMAVKEKSGPEKEKRSSQSALRRCCWRRFVPCVRVVGVDASRVVCSCVVSRVAVAWDVGLT